MGWVKSWWSSAHDEIRFRIHDRTSRKQEIATAALRFPTHELELQMVALEAALTAELDRRFNDPIKANMHKLAAAQSAFAELADELEILDRDYRSELDDAFTRMNSLKSEIDVYKSAVRSADRDLKAAKSRISAWHTRSKSRIPVYGKRGKSIPRHSFFRFSHSDLSAAKDDADRAATRIADAIRNRNRISSLMDGVSKEIAEIKAGKAKRRTMLDEGRKRQHILAEMKPVLFEIDRLTGAEDRLLSSRKTYAEAGPEALQIAELKKQIALQLEHRSNALASFDAPAARARRRLTFLSGVVSDPT